jgi:hypothetical protein
VLNDLGIPWPDADSGKARDAATAWKAIASAAQDALGSTNSAVASLSTHNTGPAMDAFGTFWAGVGGPIEACTVGPPSMLPVLIEACNALSTACGKFADAVDDAKRELEETAAEIATAIAAGVGATVLTLGMSDFVGGGVVAALSATALGTIEVLGTTIAEIAGEITMGAVFGGLDALLETDFGNAAKTALGEELPSPQDEIEGLLKALAIGSLTGGARSLLTGAAKTASGAAALNVPESVSTLIPQLPAILDQIPDALETPAGLALKTLVSEQAAGHVVNGVRGKGTDAPTLPEVLGELLNAKIEASATSEPGGEK